LDFNRCGIKVFDGGWIDGEWTMIAAVNHGGILGE
jgi:hypothetical protein